MIKFLSFLILLCFAKAQTEIQPSHPQIGSHRSTQKNITTTSQHTTTQSHQKKPETCPRNCVEAVHALDQVYHLRQQIEQAKHAQNPHYAMKAINQTKIQGSGQHCQADCAQVKGIQRQIEKYQTDLAKIKATPPQNQKTTALVVHQGKTTHQEHPSATSPTQSHHDSQEQCPKNCKQEGMMLRQIVKYERDIETQKHRLDPHYKVRQIQDVDMSKYVTTCHVDCPHILDLRRQHSDLRTELDHLKDKQPTQSSAIVPHQPVAT